MIFQGLNIVIIKFLKGTYMFQKATKYFELFYEDLFDDLGLTTFYRQSFVLFLELVKDNEASYVYY